MRNGVRFRGGGRAQVPSLPVDGPFKRHTHGKPFIAFQFPVLQASPDRFLDLALGCDTDLFEKLANLLVEGVFVHVPVLDSVAASGDSSIAPLEWGWS
jgi:hypothetical protein